VATYVIPIYIQKRNLDPNVTIVARTVPEHSSHLNAKQYD
jgi:hypothetical protein